MMKKKLMAMAVVLLFIVIQFSVVEAEEENQETTSDGLSVVEVGYLNLDGSVVTENLLLSESDISNLQAAISSLIERIQKAESFESVLAILSAEPDPNIPFLGTIIKLLTSKLTLNRGFVISAGSGYEWNFLKKSQFKIRKSLAFWHYSSSGKGFGGMTLFIKPFRFKIKLLRGNQIGLMSRFLGLYIYISRNLPEKSYTFFIGTAKRINGWQLPNLN
jgi:hypothetical protein